MRKKRLAAKAFAFAMTALTVCSAGNVSEIKAAEVSDKPNLSFEIDGQCEEKKIAKADADVINEAFGYEWGSNIVHICGEDAAGYINWDESSIPFWKIYATAVLTPDLSRDETGRLVVNTDENGNVEMKDEGTLYGWQEWYPLDYNDPNQMVAADGDYFTFVPQKGYDCSRWGDFAINNNLGKTHFEWKYEYGGGAEIDDVYDVYILRVYYSTDDKINYTQTGWMKYNLLGSTYDVNGNYVEINSEEEADQYNEGRTFAYSDWWILPEGVSTVLNFEDVTPEPEPTEENYTLDLSDIQTISADTFAEILAENATKDVVIKSNNDVTFTFAKGTMSSVDGKTEYDFSTSINSAYADTMPSYITKDNFVSQINFNYSGKLPGTANIRFYAGKQYAGQTLYYSLMNADNTFAEVQAVVVDSDGYMTVKQDHCSNYVVTKTEPKSADNSSNTSATDNNTSAGNTTVSADKNVSSANTAVTSPKTGDTTPIIPFAMIAVAGAGLIAVSRKRRNV